MFVSSLLGSSLSKLEKLTSVEFEVSCTYVEHKTNGDEPFGVELRPPCGNLSMQVKIADLLLLRGSTATGIILNFLLICSICIELINLGLSSIKSVSWVDSFGSFDRGDLFATAPILKLDFSVFKNLLPLSPNPELDLLLSDRFKCFIFAD